MMSELAAFAVTTVAVIVLGPLSRRFNLLDLPGGRKIHDGDIPLTGGLAMALGLIAGICLKPELRSSTDMLSLAGVAIAFLAVGVVDDTQRLSPRVRIVATLLMSMLVVRMERYQLGNLGDLLGLGEIMTGFLAIPFTLFCIVGVVNALNMSDGVDGLAGGLSVVALAAMALLSTAAGDVKLLGLESILIAAVLGFLCFNVRTPLRKRASVFMGDSGSMFLGFLLGALLIGLSQSAPGQVRVIAPATALWLLALPLMDSVTLLIRRMWSGRSPFSADREHLHHVLQDAGYTPGQSVFIMLVLASILALVGVLGQRFGMPEPVMFGGFMLLFVVYYVGMHFARVTSE